MSDHPPPETPVSIHRCSPAEEGWIREYPGVETAGVETAQLPISGSDQRIDVLVTGSETENRLNLLATVSDWNRPPPTVCILPPGADGERRRLECHPRIGRSIFFCEPERTAVLDALARCFAFGRQRGDDFLGDATACPFTGEQISPRWLFESMMARLDEYLYFKDERSRFLAVSQYLVEKCRQSNPAEVLGKDDFSFFDRKHAEEAFADEMKIVRAELDEIDKDESIERDGEERWVASRKFPLRTRSGYFAGTFGISRDITDAKRLRQQLERSNRQILAELDLAKNLQETLIEQSSRAFDETAGDLPFAFATKYIPSSHLSGDFFSLRETPSGKAGILIADVMGHGVRSAMVTAMIQIAVRQLRKSADDPAEFLGRLNRVLHRSLNRSGQLLFATALYATLDPASGDFAFAQAGARHGIRSPDRADADPAPDPFRNRQPGPALGLLEEAAYETSGFGFGHGETILLFTDGITEAPSPAGEEFGEERLVRFLGEHRGESPAAIADRLIAAIRRHAGHREPADDICLVAIRRSDDAD